MLLRFDPIRDLNRVFEELWGPEGSRSVPMDAYRREGMFVMHFDLPGVDPDTIDLKVENDVLTVRAERAWKEEKGDEILVRERPQGVFERHLFVSERVDREHVEARYENGVLTVRIPLLEAAKVHRIPVALESPKEPEAAPSGDGASAT
jgi:HSP20 family protein